MRAVVGEYNVDDQPRRRGGPPPEYVGRSEGRREAWRIKDRCRIPEAVSEVCRGPGVPAAATRSTLWSTVCFTTLLSILC